MTTIPTTKYARSGDVHIAYQVGGEGGVRCAGAIVREVRRLGLEIRAGLHTGECELLGDKLSGIAVHTGARVASRLKTAAPRFSRGSRVNGISMPLRPASEPNP